ncbi:MAG: hypothetical protein DRP87_13155 [Spirochaetes bacterium]|nr:MAG: hypothetical protein DRP87_13155 [Spirochaetota bacterium]
MEFLQGRKGLSSADISRSFAGEGVRWRDHPSRKQIEKIYQISVTIDSLKCSICIIIEELHEKIILFVLY